MAGNLREGGLRLTVEGYSEFIQQTGQASEAVTQFGQSAQAASSQINQSASSWGEINSQLSRLSSEQLNAVQKRYEELSADLLANNQAIGRGVSANDLYAQALREVTSESATAGKSIQDTGKKTKDSGDEAKGASDSFIALGAALTLVSAKATELVYGMTLVSSRVTELEILLEVTRKNAADLAVAEGRFTEASELNASAVQEQVQSIRDLHLSGIVANETVAQLIRYQLDWTKASELAREAQDAATFAAQDSSQALEGLIKGIVTLQPRILRTYGIMVNLNEAYRDYAKENNLVADELTQIERQQAALNAVLAQAPRIAGAYEASLGAATKQIRSIYTDTQDLAEAYGEYLEPALAGAASGFRQLLQGLTNLDGPVRAGVSGFLASGTALLTITSAGATLLPILKRERSGFSDLATSIGISGKAMAGLSLGIPIAIGVVSALVAAEKAHIAEASQVAATADTYATYVWSLKVAREESRLLTKQLWEQVKAQDAANQAAYAARLLEEQRDMYTRLQQAIDRFGGSLDKALEAWRANTDGLDEFKLAVMADEEAMYNLAIRLEDDEQKARAWAKAVSEMATATIRAREQQERLEKVSLPEYIEDEEKKVTRLTASLEGYSDVLSEIIVKTNEFGFGLEELSRVSEQDITKFLDAVNDALDDANESIIDAGIRRTRALEDLDIEYIQKADEIWQDYQNEIADIEGGIAAFHAGTLQELLDLDREYLQDRNDAWAKYQQDLEDINRDFQRDLEDANTKRLQDIADADADYARDREDALRELNQDLEDAAEEHAQNLIDIENDRQKSLLELEQEYQDRLYEIQNLAQQKLRDLQDKYAESESDARLKYLRQALEYLRDQGIMVSDAYEDLLRQLFISGDESIFANIVQRDVRDIYRALLEELGILHDDQMWEEEDLSDDIDREQERRLEDLEEWLSEEQQAIEEAYQEQIAAEEERYAEEQAARQEDYRRRLEDLQRAHERERAEIELNYQRRLEDLRIQAERERQAAAEDYARRLEDLDIQYQRERELIRSKLEERARDAREKYRDARQDLEDAMGRERDTINLQYDRTIEDANAKLEQMVREAGEKYGLLPDALKPTYHILKRDLHGLLFGDPDSLTNQWQQFIDHLRYKVFDASSPSRVMMKLAEDVLAGWEKGASSASLSDALTGSFDAMALEANIRAAMPVNVAGVPGGLGRSNINNSRTSNLVVNAQYAHQSEASLRDDLALYNSMLGAWYR